MHSCGRALLAATVLVTTSVLLHAQDDAADAYRRMRDREAALRQQLDEMPAPGGSGTSVRIAVLQRTRTMVEAYETFSKTYRTTGYADNALWQAAMLAGDAFRSFGDNRERQTALRLLADLGGRFPSSSLNAGVAAYRERLTGSGNAGADATPAPARAPARPPTPAPAPAAKTAQPPAAAPVRTTAPARGATLTEIRRELLPETVRVTLFLEEEPVFTSERLDGPPRLSIDLQNTRVVYALKDARLPYQDAAIVKQVRIGPFERGRTRVVLDLTADAGRHSMYALYNPYRLVVDFDRGGRSSALVARADKAPAASRPAVTAGGPAVRATPSATRTPAAPQMRALPPSAGSAVSLSRQLGLGAARVVIDPGHGGHDPGAQGDSLDEAELVLDVALRLEQLLSAVPGMDVVLTRRRNEYVALEERTAIANRAGADLFLSIHANASPNRNARGVETYFLDFAPNAEAEAIAARENAGSAKTMRNLTDIVRAIALNDKLDESKDFASRVQAALYAGVRKANSQAKNLGVKQAPFQVLVGATMPSVLAEISFVTNEREGALLKTDKYRTQLAQALFEGIISYQQSLKSVRVAAGR